MLRTFDSRFAVLALVSSILFGCAAPQKMIHADYDRRASKILSIGVLDPDVALYQLSGGASEKIDTWSEQGKQNFIEALKKGLSQKAFVVKLIGREGEFRESAEEISGLFYTIIHNFRNMFFWKQKAGLSPKKQDLFNYSVGHLGEILDAHHVDALLLVRGVSGRSGGVLAQGATSVNIALADRDGALLWYDDFYLEGMNTARDLRKAENVKTIIENMLASLPEAAK